MRWRVGGKCKCRMQFAAACTRGDTRARWMCNAHTHNARKQDFSWCWTHVNFLGSPLWVWRIIEMLRLIGRPYMQNWCKISNTLDDLWAIRCGRLFRSVFKAATPRTMQVKLGFVQMLFEENSLLLLTHSGTFPRLNFSLVIRTISLSNCQ